MLFLLPNEIVQVIESFVGLRCCGGWRAVNHQAYKDVEARSKAVLLHLGFRALKFPSFDNSYWFQVMRCTYNCQMCKEHTSYSHVQGVAKANKLCNDCFNASQEWLVCDVCFMSQTHITYNKCHNCQVLVCDDCSDDALDMCLGCTYLFCQACIRDDYCSFCQD
jgi:hypothetical protein